MAFKQGHTHSLAWYEAMSKPRPQSVKNAISKAQKGRKHQPQEGFQVGHPSISGTETTRFKRGFGPWNKGIGAGTDPIKLKIRTYRANAKKRGMAFDITEDQMREFCSSACSYCGEPATGIDRVDNTQGYIEGNMVACCEVCNHMKWNLTREAFLTKCHQIVTVTGYEI